MLERSQESGGHEITPQDVRGYLMENARDLQAIDVVLSPKRDSAGQSIPLTSDQQQRIDKILSQRKHQQVADNTELLEKQRAFLVDMQDEWIEEGTKLQMDRADLVRALKEQGPKPNTR